MMIDIDNDVDVLLAGQTERTEVPEMRKIKCAMKLYVKNKIRVKNAEELLDEIPKTGETIHMVSNGKFDYWNIVPVLISKMGGVIEEFYGSTWTMNRRNVDEMMNLYDEKMIKKMSILTGVYFKRRETSVYAMLLNGLIARKQKYAAFENHTKILLLTNNADYITAEGSANFTANPRFEQTVITNDKALYEFHKTWMDEILK